MQKHINFLDFEELSRNLNPSGANNIDVATVIEGFSKGNMDQDLYNPYRNYKPILLNKNDPAIMAKAYWFAITDLQLYLDVHPDDMATKELFNKYVEEFHRLEKQVESKDGPITVASNYNLTPTWVWQKNWPFEGDGK